MIIFVWFAGYTVVLVGVMALLYTLDMRQFNKRRAREQAELKARREAELELIMYEGRELIRQRQERELLQRERMNQYLEGKR